MGRSSKDKWDDKGQMGKGQMGRSSLKDKWDVEGQMGRSSLIQK